MQAVQQTARRAIANRFIVSDRIATHGASRLYRASQAETGRLVAIREFTPSDGQAATALATLSRLGSLSSRFLAELIDAAVVEGETIYVAHAMLNGEPMTQRLARKSAMLPTEAAALCVRVLKGLEALHRRELVHGGLRPSRVFHERTAKKGWHVKLLSAGVPSISREEARALPDIARYAPPEWLAGDPWTAQGDVYSAAVIFCAALGGPELVVSASAGAEGLVNALGSRAPQDIVPLLLDALSNDPSKRPANAQTMLDRILEVYPEREPEPKPEAAVPTQQTWTQGKFVGKQLAASLVLPPALESRTVVARRSREVRRARWIAIAASACAAAVVVLAFVVQAQRRERALVERLERERDAARARIPTERTFAPPPPVAPLIERPPVAPIQVVAPTSPNAPDPNAGANVPTAPRSTGTHHSVAHPSSQQTTAESHPPTPAGGGMGQLAIRARDGCQLVLDGVTRGRISVLDTTVTAGTHQLTCLRRGGSVQRLVVRVPGGGRATVRINEVGEAEISVDNVPSS